ncbi:MAG: hypothetical protein ABIQ44_14305, partial [Chloroflexia bacterium]
QTTTTPIVSQPGISWWVLPLIAIPSIALSLWLLYSSNRTAYRRLNQPFHTLSPKTEDMLRENWKRGWDKENPNDNTHRND